MAKRGESGLSLVVGVDKPLGMTSHDVVSRCRRLFGEKRVGHAGTLDPAASGVLLVCVGNATRLDKYLVGHDKTYEVEVAFGAATDTDDAEGEIIQEAPVPGLMADVAFAQNFVQTLVGPSMQMPPLYSAIKKDGKKACDEARKGNEVQLEARPVEIYSIDLLEILEADESCPYLRWKLKVHVSKGTYIRSFARDLGVSLATVAHVHALRRVQSGAVTVDSCSSLEALGELLTQAALDPVELLGLRCAFADDEAAKRIVNGNGLKASVFSLLEPPSSRGPIRSDCCMPSMVASDRAPEPEELISVIHNNKLLAIYRFDGATRSWKADCVFQTPVAREGFAL